MPDRWEERSRGDIRDDRGYRGRDDRGVIDRAGDEVRSWFGDEEAARRRRIDELREDRYDRDRSDRPGHVGERAWERTRETVRDMTDRDRDGRRGLAEWNDHDRAWDRSRDSRAYGSSWSNAVDRSGWDRDEYRTRSYAEPPRYSATDTYATPAWGGTTPMTSRSGYDTSYTGRGPRGYRRGDERIREDVCDRLTDDPRVDASDMEVLVNNGEVTLTGSVRTRDEKRFAEDLIERISGVREVSNNLKVKPPDEVIGTARSGASMLGLSDTPPPTPTNKK